jgi:hypothetical protein
MNKFLNYFPREKVFDVNSIEINEQQLISLMYHASHGIMQLQIQRAGKSINDFQTLDTLKVFFSQQHDCDKLEERIMRVDDKASEQKSKNKNKNKKRKAKNADNEAESSKKGSQKKPVASNQVCSNCGKTGHKSENCWSLDKNAIK